MAGSETPCPLDVADGLERAGGEMDFYKELLDLLLEDVPPRIVELRAAAAAADPVKVAGVAHAIKGAAANLAATPLREAALTLEMKGREGVAAGLEPMIERLDAELARLAEFVKTIC
ncbi:MAG: Hpt domain-containing protein [Candidatus Polarisedimenticolia bacterium]|nr:Hpt domain-containing protein [bacterium]